MSGESHPAPYHRDPVPDPPAGSSDAPVKPPVRTSGSVRPRDDACRDVDRYLELTRLALLEAIHKGKRIQI
jgi:hypothetical protein